MLRYITRRVLAMIPLLLAATILTFLLGQYGAGDLAAYLTMQQSGGQFHPEAYEAMRKELGLDDPSLVRYGRWLRNALHGDLGRSYIMQGQPGVTYLIKRAIPISLQLGLAALIVVVSLGIPLGVLAAVTQK